MLGVNIEILTWLMRNPRLGQSVEYADNRISYMRHSVENAFIFGQNARTP